MDIDWPSPKRRRIDGSWWETLPEDSALWGLCDALALYASGSGPTTTMRTSGAGGPTGIGGSGPSGGPARSGLGPELRASVLSSPSSSSSSGPVEAVVVTAEPLLRTLTQLANAAAAGSGARRQLVAQCQIHAPLLRLMQLPWARQPLVIERCCRLLHWLCAHTPENREILAAHRGACAASGARSVSFAEAVLAAAEAHPSCREVLAHALRALVALLPCPSVREELLRSQPRLLTCLVIAGEALDVVAVRAVYRWLPSISGQVRRALLDRVGASPEPRSKADESRRAGSVNYQGAAMEEASRGVTAPLYADADVDMMVDSVDMADL